MNKRESYNFPYKMVSCRATPAVPRDVLSAAGPHDQTVFARLEPHPSSSGMVHILAWRQEGAMNRAPTDMLSLNPCSGCPTMFAYGHIHRALLPACHARIYSPVTDM